MKTQRLFIALAVLNLGLLVFLLAQIEVRFLGFRFLPRSVEVNSVGSVLRGRALEITDDEGRIRASIKVHPADRTLPYPETVILRLINENGGPSVKLATTEQGGGLVLGGDSASTYVQLSAHGLRLTKEGQQQMIPWASLPGPEGTRLIESTVARSCPAATIEPARVGLLLVGGRTVLRHSRARLCSRSDLRERMAH